VLSEVKVQGHRKVPSFGYGCVLRREYQNVYTFESPVGSTKGARNTYI